jgi:hypothetical protein
MGEVTNELAAEMFMAIIFWEACPRERASFDTKGYYSPI